MSNERDPGATFAPGDIGWIDFEVRGRTSIKAGTYRYATEADAIILAYALGDDPVRAVAVKSFDRALGWFDLPLSLYAHHEKVRRGKAIWAAWNAGFDRAVWNYSMLGSPLLVPRHIIDVMAQAAASGLPADLASAAKYSGSTRKDSAGKDLIRLFCLPESVATPQTHPAQWQQFVAYAGADIEAMRSVFLGTRQLSLAEWREYWAMEAINQRGVGIDLVMAEHAAKLADEDRVRAKDELRALTDGAVSSPDEVAKLTKWLLERLPAEGRAILTARDEEIDENGLVTKSAKHSLTRRRVERLIALCQSDAFNTTELNGAMALLQIRLYGGSRTPAKFRKMLDQHVDGTLYGQYVFNGASQTGRASSKGVQVHNLARDVLENERATIERVRNGCSYEDLADRDGADPVARQLSLLIRPTFVPRGDDVFIWSDWSQIEARVLPWLCDHYPKARARLDIFREVDADPSLPDLYTRTAAEISHLPIELVTRPIRQRGKVAELALGFCGGVDALQSMAASYGMHLGDAEARQIVDRWRLANSWAGDYGREIMEHIRLARTLPGALHQVGRVHLVFKDDYLGGSLLAVLPSLRVLTYRAMRQEYVDVLDKDDQPTGEKRLELTFARGHGRMKVWPGLFVENFTQAVAADFLRGTLRRLEDAGLSTVLHSHDEIVLEVARKQAEVALAQLRAIMRQGFDWSGGLPLMSEETCGYYYSKSEEAHGL